MVINLPEPIKNIHGELVTCPNCGGNIIRSEFTVVEVAYTWNKENWIRRGSAVNRTVKLVCENCTFTETLKAEKLNLD